MKSKFNLLLFAFATFFVASVQGQNDSGQNYVGTSSTHRYVPSFESRTNELVPAVKRTTPPNDGRSAKVEIIPGKDPQTANDFLSENQHETAGIIPARALLNNFVVDSNVSSPSDPAIAVGPDHVFIVYNTGFIIYDKDGNVLQGATNPNAIFSNGGCCDLTASYDNLADRWVITYLFVGAGMEIAVSDGPDPLTSGWNVYSLPQVVDYNKLSVWRDGYYVTDNGVNDVWAIDRTAALAGANNVGIQGFSVPGAQGQNFTSAQVFNITNDNHPTTGGAPMVYMRDDGFAGVSEDAINIWTVNVDFETPANSNVSDPEVFPTEPFINVFDGGSFANLTQPGGSDIDALQSTIMNQAQFRKFPTYNSAIFNFVVDTDAGAGELAGIRWYEFRQDTDGGVWTMMQEGTFTAPEGKHAWNGSMAMDNQGNIGMGYSVMAGPTTPNPTEHRVGSAYTGRFFADAPGTMTIAEDRFGISASNVAGNRFGDYAKMDVDPSDDQSFWFITEYANTNHVAVFKIAPDADVDMGVIAIVTPETGALSATESIEVMVRNFGTLEQSNVPVSFTVNGITVNEVVPGPITSGSNVSYTFTATADLSVDGTTYTITSCTGLVGDEDSENDCVDKTVVHLFDNDAGVIAIDTPTTGNVLSDTEEVTISIQNFGAVAQSNIPVFYSVNGTVVNDVYPGPIAIGATDTFTFATPADLSVIGVYTIVSGTELVNDGDETNDDITKMVENIEGFCLPIVTTEDPDNPESGCNLDGIKMFVLNTISADDGGDGCNTEPTGGPKGYADRTDLSTVLSNLAGSNVYNLQAQTNFVPESFSVWIDFNDDLVFDESERLISNESFLVAAQLTDFELTIPVGAPVGSHVLRARAIDPTGGDPLDPCGDYTFGETQDYTVDIQAILGLGEDDFTQAEFIVTSLANNHFELNFNTTDYLNELPVHVYNTLGQNLAFYTLENNGAGFNKTIDMSYVSTGVYFIKVGGNDDSRVHRIVVK